MGDNQFRGTLPTEIFQLTSLVLLEMNDLGPKISGSIPTEIGRLTALEQFDAEEVLLEGTVPTEIGHCTNLRIFNIPSNNVKGTLPTEMALLKKLEYMDVRTNPGLIKPLLKQVCEAFASDLLYFYPGASGCEAKTS